MVNSVLYSPGKGEAVAEVEEGVGAGGSGMGGRKHSMRRMTPMAVGKPRVQHLVMKHRVNQSQRDGGSKGMFQDIPLVKKVVMLSH
jgi:hypothetical protein